MSGNAVTHLNFRGDARTALTFYQSVFGGDVAAVTRDAADAALEPAVRPIRLRLGSAPSGSRA